MAKKTKMVNPEPQARWTRTLYITLFIVAGLGLLIGYRLLSVRSEPTTTVSIEVLALGERSYASSCAACHGSEGQGVRETNTPALNGSMHTWHHSDEQLISQLRNGGTSMPAVGAEWDDEEITAVISYIKQWWRPQQRFSQQGNLGE